MQSLTAMRDECAQQTTVFAYRTGFHSPGAAAMSRSAEDLAFSLDFGFQHDHDYGAGPGHDRVDYACHVGSQKGHDSIKSMKARIVGASTIDASSADAKTSDSTDETIMASGIRGSHMAPIHSKDLADDQAEDSEEDQQEVCGAGGQRRGPPPSPPLRRRRLLLIPGFRPGPPGRLRDVVEAARISPQQGCAAA
ncbi:unnamed protein product [Prorocentrum cordatum]|uniref:Uncharacterized protein n=1 Tax=Prorocentrum cordatum TaxID=2364126 RepID=A0ABN9S5Y3_9DINO|nr:unnamed protein product [Polarella glacialis]